METLAPTKLKFGRGNAKLGKNVITFSLPAGHSCPFADKCLAKANRLTGKIKDGPHSEFRCFSASSESIFPSTRKSRWYNFNLLRNLSLEEMIEIIQKSLPEGNIFRIHVSGDFFSETYFLAWLTVIKSNPEKLFYAYTKSLKYWVEWSHYIPSNFVLTASYGGKHDHLIEQYNLRKAVVVFSVGEARKLGLQIDHDDSHAMKPGRDFALLLHGKQPTGSKAASYLKYLDGFGSYSREK